MLRNLLCRPIVLTALSMLLATAGLAGEQVIETIVGPATETNRRNTEGDLAVLQDGTYLLGWSDFYGGARDDSAGRISAVRSTDGGRTWGPRFTLQENVGQQNVMSVSFLPLRSGDILFFLLIHNPTVRLGTGHSGPRTPLVAALSTDEGRTWSEPRAIESDLSAHYAYTSVRFHEDRALVSYYVAHGGLLSLKFKSIPLAWFRE